MMNEVQKIVSGRMSTNQRINLAGVYSSRIQLVWKYFTSNRQLLGVGLMPCDGGCVFSTRINSHIPLCTSACSSIETQEHIKLIRSLSLSLSLSLYIYIYIHLDMYVLCLCCHGIRVRRCDDTNGQRPTNHSCWEVRHQCIGYH